jgi:hypothetical protein
MKKTFTTLYIICLLSGCIISSHQSHQKLVESYHNEFVTSQNIKILSVAAILKSFITQLNNNPCNSWDCITEIKEGYIGKLKKENISENYPVMASPNEIKFVNDFLSDLIRSLRKQKIESHHARKYISDTSTILLVDIINYETQIH